MLTRIRQYRRFRPVLFRLLLIPLFLLLAAGLAPTLIATASAAPAASCAGPVAGKHIYDCAGILTPSKIADLETQAKALARVGAPNVVYLQVRAASPQETLQDAKNLMNQWDVESHAGAYDGFVMFFNLQPGNTAHGAVALYAGAKYYQNGALPQSELDRIRDDVMTPLLAQGDISDGIAAGLRAVAHDVQYGLPSPQASEPAGEQVVSFLARIPLTILAVLLVVVLAFLWVRLPRWPVSQGGGKPDAMTQASASPGDLPPGIVGALVARQVNNAQLEGTVLDFAGRGLLTLEPVDSTKAQVHLRGGSRQTMSALGGYEQETWKSLVTLAGSEHGTIHSDQLGTLSQQWAKARSELRSELSARGWFDAHAADVRRKPFQTLGKVGLIGAVVALLLIVASNEGWGAIGMTLFLGAGVAAFIRGARVSDITAEGERAAMPWRIYQARLTSLDSDPKFDADLPYIVALGIESKLRPRLQTASDRGFSPSWFQPGMSPTTTSRAGFYPSWVAFHGAMPSSGSFGGGFGGGFGGEGAAMGGGGSAGRF